MSDHKATDLNRPVVVVMWSRFGPYHLARLRGAAEALPEAQVVGLEVAGQDRDYAWERIRGARGFERVTIFPDANYHDLSAQDLAAGVRASLDRIQPDFLAVNGWSVPEARAALGWARKSGSPAILMSESKADDRSRVWWKELAKRAVIQKFDAALVGGRMQVAYLSQLGFPSRRVRLGYNAIDNDYFEEHADRTRTEQVLLRDELGLPDRFFFACTRFLARKNIDGLLRAYALYRARTQTPWSLVIAGSGEEDAALRQLARDLGVGEAVVWPGFVQYSDLPSYFALADAFVHPAKSEAWGLVVNEAAACATPLLVARTVGAAAELLVEGETGLLFDAHDDADICRALTTIAQASDDELRRIGQNARTLVARFGPQRFGAELAATISDLSHSKLVRVRVQASSRQSPNRTCVGRRCGDA